MEVDLGPEALPYSGTSTVRRAGPIHAARIAMGCVLAFVLCQPAAAKGGKHPSLVDPTTAKCSTCHSEVLAGKVRHEPAKDGCLGCHELRKADGQTLASLAAPEPAICLTCHDALSKAAQGEMKSPHPPVKESCSGCHDPHSSANAKLLKSPERETCTACHDASGLDKVHTVPLGRASCVGCHAPHGSDVAGMLARTRLHPPFSEKSCDACHQKGRAVRGRKGGKTMQAETCFACHSELEARLAKGSVHTVVRQGSCTGCHDPHLSDEGNYLKAKGPSLCSPCHEDVKTKVSGPGAHAPARDDCGGCHGAHSGAEPNLLSDRPPALCTSCHDAADAALGKKHLGADLGKLACLTCHDPHGGAKALIHSASTHLPFAEGACDSCHAGAASKLVEGGGTKLCVTCHADVAEGAKKAAFRHAAMDGECTACHGPHASAQARLLRLEAGGECLECHDDVAPAKDELGHGIIALAGCRACHEPHGSSRRKLLRDDASQLCLGCHDGARMGPLQGKATVVFLGRFEVPARKVEGMRTLTKVSEGHYNHPATGHRTLGVPTEKELKSLGKDATFRGELTCLTCHDPHKGKSRWLLAGGAVSGLETCARCHKK